MNECPQCQASGFFEVPDVDTDLCIVCYRDSIPAAQRRTAWRCHHCKVTNPWLKQEYLHDDKAYCDEMCAADRQAMIEAYSS